MPASRQDYWEAKFKTNMVRDVAVSGSLRRAGWRVATIWECALKKPAQVAAATDRLAAWLRGDERELEIGETDLEQT